MTPCARSASALSTLSYGTCDHAGRLAVCIRSRIAAGITGESGETVGDAPFSCINQGMHDLFLMHPYAGIQGLCRDRRATTSAAIHHASFDPHVHRVTVVINAQLSMPRP